MSEHFFFIDLSPAAGVGADTRGSETLRRCLDSRELLMAIDAEFGMGLNVRMTFYRYEMDTQYADRVDISNRLPLLTLVVSSALQMF